MKKLYYLSTCSTCTRIIKELGGLEDFDQQNVKENPINKKQIDELKKMSGSYESLFNRRSMKYRSRKLADQDLTEADYRQLISEEYTFLKRPVLVIDDEIFIGNAKKTVAAAKEKLS